MGGSIKRFLVWINTGASGWYPVPCTTWSMAELCYRVLIQTGVPAFAIVITREVDRPAP